MLSITKDESLVSFNTMGLPSRAAALVRYVDASQLPRLTETVGQYRKAFVLGGGSNVILEPQVSGLVVKVETAGIRLLHEQGDELIVEAQGGENWHAFVSHCVAQGWYGLENLALIPGTVGAAPVQNIGAYGVELDQRFHSLLAWNLREGRMVEMAPADCGFAYRDSVFKRAEAGQWLIVALRLRLSRAWQPVLDYPALAGHPLVSDRAAVTPQRVYDAVCDIRRSKLPDPAILGNAGSFFKNPVVSAADYQRLRAAYPSVVAYPQESGAYKLAAGWLIDQAGWKGRRMGPAGVHDKQALVLVNYGGATADDINQLAQSVRNDVQARFGVLLEQEPVAVR
ncbi:MAG TPA: UDP-N-acetylmuramate dehydrogenase [Pusillimonas sp.]|uniref:UDP-N-acetylmuramate dehydrogenase n=1 Tax=Pusillimonas sp. TaxID=3040095 RepID=UPI002CCC0437|nr:UDP-N-acetylmuramate dehydrogenase [Pusillimonas sp.]HUH87543.1 UDP-N-acetylmuramate dehydrogenase [Pusillimonas sp.]